MSLFAVKRHDDKFLCFDDFSDPQWDECPDIFSKGEAESLAEDYRGHIVEFVEKSAPVVVSDVEAKILEGAKKDKHPCMYIAWKVQVDDEDRLLRAYVIGWTVEKPKRFVLPMPSGNQLEDTRSGTYFARKLKQFGWMQTKSRHHISTVTNSGSYRVTQQDIDSAPDWVKAITPVEVTP